WSGAVRRSIDRTLLLRKGRSTRAVDPRRAERLKSTMTASSNPSLATPAASAEGVAPVHPASLKRLALRGSAWVVLEQFVAYILRLLSNLALTRLLFPEAFGLMALVNATLRGLKMFSDIGLNLSIIQN